MWTLYITNNSSELQKSYLQCISFPNPQDDLQHLHAQKVLLPSSRPVIQGLPTLQVQYGAPLQTPGSPHRRNDARSLL